MPSPTRQTVASVERRRSPDDRLVGRIGCNRIDAGCQPGSGAAVDRRRVSARCIDDGFDGGLREQECALIGGESEADLQGVVPGAAENARGYVEVRSKECRTGRVAAGDEPAERSSARIQIPAD